MASWLVVWFVIGIASTLAILACLLGLVRHVLILGRTVKQLQEDLRPIADDVVKEGQRATDHAAALGDRRRVERSPANRGPNPGPNPGRNPGRKPRVESRGG